MDASKSHRIKDELVARATAQHAFSVFTKIAFAADRLERSPDRAEREGAFARRAVLFTSQANGFLRVNHDLLTVLNSFFDATQSRATLAAASGVTASSETGMFLPVSPRLATNC